MPDAIVWDTALPHRALVLPEVAAFLQCSHKTVYRELERKRLRGFKVGTDWRVLPEDLIAYTRGDVA